MSDRETVLERLRDVHSFPGPYLFKAIGPNTPDFVAAVLQAIINIAGPEASPEMQTRESGQGNQQSVTVTVTLARAEQVLDVYEVLSNVNGIRYVF